MLTSCTAADITSVRQKDGRQKMGGKRCLWEVRLLFLPRIFLPEVVDEPEPHKSSRSSYCLRMRMAQSSSGSLGALPSATLVPP